MQILTLIFSGLAFVCATSALSLVLQERKSLGFRLRSLRSKIDSGLKEQREFAMKYADEKTGSALGETEKLMKDMDSRTMEKIKQVTRYARAVSEKAGEELHLHEKRLSDLEHGMVPDYDEALKAINAVNDFNKGISGILGFDPMIALEKSRTEGE